MSVEFLQTHFFNLVIRMSIKCLSNADIKDINGPKFIFSKVAFTKNEMLDKIKKLRSPGWILCHDDSFWYIVHEERIVNLKMRERKYLQ